MSASTQIGSGPRAGGIRVGSYDADEAAAWWRLWDGPRLASGVIIGGPEGGALDVLAAVGLGARDHGAEVWFVDPAFGASSAVLAATADRVVPFSSSHRLVEELESELLARCRHQAESLTRGPAEITATERPRPLLVAVAEGEEVLDDYLLRRVFERVARYGGRVGIALAMVVRSASFAAFGGSAGLRHALLSQNVASTYSAVPDPLDAEPLPWMDDVDIELSLGQGYLAYRGRLERVMPFWIDAAISLPLEFARECAQQSGPGAETAEAATGRTPERRFDP